METDLCHLAPSTWERLQIQDVCLRVTSGGTPSRRKPEFFFNGEWPWIKSQELQDGWVNDTEEKITKKAVNSSSTKVLPPETVLIALYGATVGQLGLLRREMTCNQACCAIIVDPQKAHFRFLFYQLLHVRPFLKLLATGAAQQNLSGQLIKSLTFPFPPLPEQHAIAHILGTLDDKIELNRRMNETLEAMARALFKSWFVDFDPVRAKAEGRDTRLPPEISDLFPEEFEDSELGEIPKGWGVRTLAQVFEINPSRTLKKDQVAPYLDMANMPTKGHCAVKVIDRAFVSGTRFINGDTLLARITPCLENGKTALVDFLEENQVGWGSTEYIVLRPIPPLPEEFAYCLARSPQFRDHAIQSMTGSSGRQRVQTDSLASFPLSLPLEAGGIADAFKGIVRPLFQRVMASQSESGTLSSLRDTLLPKLISGEIRVEEAEKYLEVVET